jgi:tRNA-binding protein
MRSAGVDEDALIVIDCLPCQTYCGEYSTGAWRCQRKKKQETQSMQAIKPTIPFDVLESIDIRAGTIELVQEVKGSHKLVKLTVNFGDHTRSILVGMKNERANPREIEGKQALFVVNLAPRTMLGEVSEGMLFDIGHADGIVPVLAMPERPVPDGTRAG